MSIAATVTNCVQQPIAWLAVGFAGQALFTARFLVQWFQSERARRSVIPMAFWYLSLAGGILLLIYALHRRDPVFILGQSAGAIVYIRNMVLRHRERREPAGESATGQLT
jgi:lipid-A-disaccharide synthase-like uncharacterized protein